MNDIRLSDEYLKAGGNGVPPHGNKVKYLKDGNWYKADPGFKEELVSELLKASNIRNFVKYTSIIVNGKNYCVSKTRWKGEVTLDKLFRMRTGRYANDVLYSLGEPKKRFEYTVEFVKSSCGVDISNYLKQVLYLDMLIGNYDRHFNNIGLTMVNGQYKPLPIFDNGDCLIEGRMEECGNFGNKHEYVIGSIGDFNSPIKFDYSKVPTYNKLLNMQLLKYEKTFRM